MRLLGLPRLAVGPLSLPCRRLYVQCLICQVSERALNPLSFLTAIEDALLFEIVRGLPL